MNDLQQLVGLKLPEDIAWWPLATGWYFIALLLLLMLVFWGYKKRLHYIKNSYRREAIKTLASIELNQAQQLLPLLQNVLQQACPTTPIEQAQQLLLSINRGSKVEVFSTSQWQLLQAFAYQNPKHIDCQQSQFITLKAQCSFWITGHQYEC